MDFTFQSKVSNNTNNVEMLTINCLSHSIELVGPMYQYGIVYNSKSVLYVQSVHCGTQGGYVVFSIITKCCKSESEWM